MFSKSWQIMFFPKFHSQSWSWGKWFLSQIDKPCHCWVCVPSPLVQTARQKLQGKPPALLFAGQSRCTRSRQPSPAVFLSFFFFFPLLQYTIHTFKLKSSEFSGTISLRINFSYFWAQPPCCADSSEARSNPGVIFLSLDLVQPHSKQIYARIISLKVDVRMNKRARIWSFAD